MDSIIDSRRRATSEFVKSMIHEDRKIQLEKAPEPWFRAHQTKIDVWSREDPASRLLAAVVFVFALFALWSMAVIQRRAYSALPWGDMWDYWIWYLKPQPSLLLKLFAQHNEHRIVVARLFFLADQKLFQGRVTLHNSTRPTHVIRTRGDIPEGVSSRAWPRARLPGIGCLLRGRSRLPFVRRDPEPCHG